MNDPYGGVEWRPLRNPYGGVGGDPNDPENRATPSNPGTWARVGGNPNAPYLYDANGNHVTTPYGGSGAGVTPGGGGAGGTTPPAAPAAAAPAAVTPVAPAANTYLGMTVPQWLQSALAVYGAYRSSQPGTFQRVPEDPSQTAARQRLLGFVDNSPTRDLLGNLIGQRLGAAQPFQLPKSPTGYNPNPSGGAPAYDLSAILPALMHGSGTTASTPPAAQADPVANSVNQWLSAHPEVTRMGVNVAAGAVAQQFNIPQEQALKFVAAFIQP